MCSLQHMEQLDRTGSTDELALAKWFESLPNAGW